MSSIFFSDREAAFKIVNPFYIFFKNNVIKKNTRNLRYLYAFGHFFLNFKHKIANYNLKGHKNAI